MENEKTCFRIQPKMDLKYLEDLVVLHNKVGKGTDVKVGRISNVVLLIAGIVMLLDAVLLVWIDQRVTFMSVFVLLVGVFALVWFALRYRIAAKRMRRNSEKLWADQEVIIDEDGIHVQGKSMEATYRFEAVEAIYFWRDSYVLYVDKIHIVPLPVNAFLEGDPDRFAAYISEKSNLPVQSAPGKSKKGA